MIIAEKENGELVLVQSWNTFREKIRGLYLTDADRIVQKLENYDMYAAQREAIALFGQPPLTVKETIYGINNLERAEKELKQTFERYKQHVVASTLHEDKLRERIGQLEKRYNTLYNKLQRYKGMKVTLQITVDPITDQDLTLLKEQKLLVVNPEGKSAVDYLSHKYSEDFKGI